MTVDPLTKTTAAMCTKLRFTTYPSICAKFYTPSDVCGLHGMKRERVRAVTSWRGGPARYDTVFIKEREDVNSITNGLTIARVQLFFTFNLNGQRHECALIEDYHYIDSSADEDTGMWIVRPSSRGRPRNSRIIPINKILRAAHLLPICGTNYKVPRSMNSGSALDSFKSFYVNKYVDHHAFEIAR